MDIASLNRSIMDLDHKSQGERVASLTSLVDALTQKPQHRLVETKMATLLYHCLACLRKHIGIVSTTKKISTTEVTLALRTLALVAINVDNDDLAQEAFKEVVPLLGEYIDLFCDQETTSASEFDPLLASELVDCLAMMAFFGTTDNFEETERVMIMLWDYLLSFKSTDSSCDQLDKNDKHTIHNDDSLVAAIRAWSFLLSFLPISGISGKHWRGCVDYFSDLLDHHDDYKTCVLAASQEALYLILEIDVLNKFSHQGYSSDTLGQSIREKISEILQFIPHKKKYNYLKDADSGSFGMIIQTRMLERLLGQEGYTSHMEKNNKFDKLFETMLRRNGNDDQGNLILPPSPERAELVVKFDVKEPNFNKQVCKKRIKSEQYSNLSKARTQLLNKQRQHVYAQFHHYYSAY